MPINAFKPDAFSDKSGSYRVIHESFSNVFNIQYERNSVGFMVVPLPVLWTVWFIKYCDKCSGGLFELCLYSHINRKHTDHWYTHRPQKVFGQICAAGYNLYD